MERAAFKLTDEYMEVLGGKESPMYEEFIVMFTKGLAAARKYATVTVTMMEIMMFKVRKRQSMKECSMNRGVPPALGN